MIPQPDVLNLKLHSNMFPERIVFNLNMFVSVNQTRTIGHNESDLVLLIHHWLWSKFDIFMVKRWTKYLLQKVIGQKTSSEY